jgi:hypothetical protein
VLGINQYEVWPQGRRKKQASFGPLIGALVEEYDARYAFDPGGLAVVGNPWGVPTFLWKDGDGTTPTIGPVGTNLAVSGVGLASGQPTQYQYPSGIDATAEETTDGASYRRDSVRSLMPGANDDAIVAVKYRQPNAAVAGGIISLCGVGSAQYSAGTGWFVFFNNDAVNFKQLIAGTARNVNIGNMVLRSPGIAIGVMNRDGDMTIWGNGRQGTTGATVAGAMAAAGIGMFTNGAATAGYTMYAHGMIEWWAVWYGVGLYETWSADSSRLIERLSYESLGLRETKTNSKYWAYSQPRGGSDSSSSFIDHNGWWRFCGDEVPRAGGPRGLLISPTTQNLAVTGGNPVTFAPAATTGITVTGGVISVVSDEVALAAAKANVWGHNVFSFVNATGSTKVAHMGASGAGGAVVPNSIEVLARYVAGAGAELGWWNTGTSTFTPVVTILDGYALTVAQNTSPPTSGTSKFAIRIPDGCTLYFIGMHRTYWPIIGFPVPYQSAEGSDFAYQDTATTEHTPVVASGSLLVNLAPHNWSGIAPGADTTVLPCVTTPGDLLHAESVAAGWATSDGTVQIQTVAPYVPTDGVYVDVWTAWKAALQYIQQGTTTSASRVTGLYDGNKGTAGALIAQSSLGDLFVKTIQVRQV